MSRIEQLIDEIEEFIESCKPQPFSQSKVVVPKDELYELLTELRLKTPDEIKRYQKIIANKDKIVSDAQAQAEKMLEETTAYTNALVEEHEIMLKAYERAEEVMNNANAQAEATISAANEDAEGIRRSALAYTEEMISSLEEVIGRTLEGVKTNAGALVEGLTYNYNILTGNKDALQKQLYSDQQESIVAASVQNNDDYDYQTPEENDEPEHEEAASRADNSDDFDYDDID